MATKIYVGDTGTVITLDCGQDISAATARAIEVRKPGGTAATWTASASGSNSIQFTSLADTFDVPGRWKGQAHITFASGEWLGETFEFDVYSAFG